MTPKPSNETRILRWVWGLVAFSVAGSLLSALTGLDPGPIRPVAGALTLLVFVWAVAKPIYKAMDKAKAVRVLAGLLLLGAGSEICGLYTGLPFGRYEYTQAWQPVVAIPGEKFFPLLLPFAWLMVVCAGYLYTSSMFTKGIAAVLAAFLATLVDVLMEWAIVVNLGYWRWTDPNWPIGHFAWGVPIMNFVGWFLVAWVGAAWLNHHGASRAKSSALGLQILLAQGVLMLCLGLISFLPKQPLFPISR